MDLNNFIDVLMHLLFLGITKSAREFILLWIVELKQMTVYKSLAYRIFQDIADMSLEWCKLIVSSSGWVSDNYVGFVRVCKWFYYPITGCLQKTESAGMINQFVGSLLSMISLIMRKHVCDEIINKIERESNYFCHSCKSLMICIITKCKIVVKRKKRNFGYLDIIICLS